MDDEQMEMVEHFKYIESLKSADGYNYCSKDTRFGIGMAKKILLGLLPIWRGRVMNKDLPDSVISSLAGVDSSHLRRRMLDSDKS